MRSTVIYRIFQASENELHSYSATLFHYKIDSDELNEALFHEKRLLVHWVTNRQKKNTADRRTQMYRNENSKKILKNCRKLSQIGLEEGKMKTHVDLMAIITYTVCQVKQLNGNKRLQK